jgi:hypothetical protein
MQRQRVSNSPSIVISTSSFQLLLIIFVLSTNYPSSFTEQPAVDKVKRWSRAELLEWIKEQRLLEDDELEKLRAAGISGKFFLTLAGKPEFFEEKCRLPVGPSGELSNLAEEITGKQGKLLSFIPYSKH